MSETMAPQVVTLVSLPNGTKTWAASHSDLVVFKLSVFASLHVRQFESGKTYFADWPDVSQKMKLTVALSMDAGTVEFEARRICADGKETCPPDAKLWEALLVRVAASDGTDEDPKEFYRTVSENNTLRGYSAVEAHNGIHRIYDSVLRLQETDAFSGVGYETRRGDIPTVGDAEELTRVIDDDAHPFLRLRSFHSSPLKSTWKPAEIPDKIDIHTFLSTLTQYPALLRRLGLIIDFELTLPRKDVSSGGRVGVVCTDTFSGYTFRSPCTWFDVDLETGWFSARPNSMEWRRGLVPLNDGRHMVTQLDTDGATLQLASLRTNLKRLKESTAPDAPQRSALPALRTTGLNLLRTGRLVSLQNAARSALEIEKAFDEGKDVCLFAESLVRGHRADVLVSGAKEWRSLCKRRLTFELPTSVDPVSDEGWFSPSVVKREDHTNTVRLFFHESLFTWDGWSLVAPRPGKVASPSGEAVDMNGDPRRLLTVHAEPAKRSLPPLRYGMTYQFRVRATDLGGNDMSDPNVELKEGASSEVTYQRFDPIASPLVFARHDLSKSLGESVDVLVIRSNFDASTSDFSERHIAPPATSIAQAETHGMLDSAHGPSKAHYDDLKTRDAASTDAPVHPEAQLVTSYLPDPACGGAALVGLSKDMTPTFGGAWPNVSGFRLIIVEGHGSPQFHEANRTLVVPLQKAEVRTVRLASSPKESALDVFALWKRAKGATTTTAKAGRYAWLTPPRFVRLVHAVRQPLREPLFAPTRECQEPLIVSRREWNQTHAVLNGHFYFDAASTATLTLSAEWQDWDDETQAAPFRPEASKARPFSRKVDYPQRTPSPMNPPDEIPFGHGQADVPKHHFADTKYRRVTYAAIAGSRFAEHFPRNEKDPLAFLRETQHDCRAVVEHKSTARPLPARVAYVVPTFGWGEPRHSTENHGRRRKVERSRLGGGLRIYLERPWYSSGDGERLAVVLWPGAKTHLGSTRLQRIGQLAGFEGGPTEIPRAWTPVVSQWGVDPLWKTAALREPLSAGDFRSAEQATALTLSEFQTDAPYDKARLVDIVHFQPEYDTERRLWYCDMQLDIGDTYCPFIRLAIARYQPVSLREPEAPETPPTRDCYLSPVILADFIQLQPGRSATVVYDRPARTFRVAVEGVTYGDSYAKRDAVIDVRLEERDQSSVTGWLPIPSHMTTLKRIEASGSAKARWEGSLRLAEGQTCDRYRLVIREREQYVSDTDDNAGRIIYLEALEP